MNDKRAPHTRLGGEMPGFAPMSAAGAHSRPLNIHGLNIHGEKTGMSRALPRPVSLLLFSLMIPSVIRVGSLALSAPRIVVMLMLVPALRRWLSGGAGRKRAADIAVLLFSLWAATSFIVVHGVESAWQSSGIIFVETMGSYLLARCYIRNADHFFAMSRLLFWIVLVLCPFALFEAMTGKNVLHRAFDAILPSGDAAPLDIRWGLIRARVVFDHPILFGICAGSALALTHLVVGYGKPTLSRWFNTSVVAVTAFMSLSSAPLAALLMQSAFIAWDWLLHRQTYRWKILWGLGLLAYATVAIGSNQTPVQFYISRMTFDPHTGWHRLLIWEYGSATVMSHPLFGIGFGDWARESWMSESVDMFWLLNAMRHGLPGGVLLLAAFFLLVVAVSRKKGLSEREKSFRTAYLIMMVSFFAVGWTVHFWGMAYIWFLFMLGSGAWLLDAGRERQAMLRDDERGMSDVLHKFRKGSPGGSRIAPAPAFVR